MPLVSSLPHSHRSCAGPRLAERPSPLGDPGIPETGRLDPGVLRSVGVGGPLSWSPEACESEGEKKSCGRKPPPPLLQLLGSARGPSGTETGKGMCEMGEMAVAAAEAETVVATWPAERGGL